jgi:hypothetical protein
MTDVRPFDPALAAYPTEVVALNRVLDPLWITHAPDRVTAYRDAMLRGDRFPPISVMRAGRRRVVVDGHKRLSAYRALGRGDIRVEIWPLRQWLRDQWRQVVANAAKNRRILTLVFVDHREAARLFRSTALHWRRVALCLIKLMLSRAAARERAVPEQPLRPLAEPARPAVGGPRRAGDAT